MTFISKELSDRLLSPDSRESEMVNAKKCLHDSKHLSIQQQIENWVILGEGNKWEKQPFFAEQAYLQTIALIKKLQDEIMLADAYKALGDVWFFSESYERCIDYYEDALKIFDKYDHANWSGVISQIAYVYAGLGQEKNEQITLSKAISKQNLPTLVRATFLERLALSLSVSDPREAIANYEKALNGFSATNFKRDWDKRIQRLSQLYESIGDYENAQKTLMRL